MFTLIVGGAGSGKSAWAEALCAAQRGPHYYLATMQPFDEECRARIGRHRAQRAHRGFVTVEQYTDLAAADIPAGSSVLLEDLGNSLANELYSPGGGGAEAVLSGVEALLARCADVTVVSNEVFSGGSDYAPGTLAYLSALAWLHRRLAARADAVIEMACGVPRLRKGAAV